MSSQLYANLPLDLKIPYIRVLELRKHPRRQQIEYSMAVYKMPEVPPSTALSYTWGREEDGTQLLPISGILLKIRQNLFDFFRAISKPFLEDMQKSSAPPVIRYWIDAICIDQNAIRERNHQAGLVHIWLGPGHDGGAEAIKLIRSQAKVTEQQVLDNIVPILSNGYWDRLWVVQEVLLARRLIIQCGPNIIPWEELVDFNDVGLLHLRMGIGRPLASQMLENKAKWMQGSGPAQLELGEAIAKFGYFDCQHRHDKVYGFLGISAKTDIKVDYCKSLVELYEDVLPVICHGPLVWFRELLETLDLERNDPEVVTVTKKYAPDFGTPSFKMREFGGRMQTLKEMDEENRMKSGHVPIPKRSKAVRLDMYHF